jgi:hypothetical protein
MRGHAYGGAGHPYDRCGTRGRERLGAMMKSFEDMQKFGKDNFESTLKSYGAMSKTMQAIAVEMAEYSKKAFDHSAAATEKLMGVKSLDKAIEVQSEYVKGAYEGFVSKAAKFNELYADLAKEAYTPFEAYVSKTAVAK